MMTEHQPSVSLRKIDPSQNIARFYALSVQPTLFGGLSVVRNWGRIGTRGQIKIQTFDRDADAASASARIERVKRRRGYAGA